MTEILVLQSLGAPDLASRAACPGACEQAWYQISRYKMSKNGIVYDWNH